MLVITRYPGEIVWIETSDGRIKVEFLEHRSSGQVRLGFDAPRDVVIYRDEVSRERSPYRGGAAVPEGKGG